METSRSTRVQRVERELFALLSNFLLHDLTAPLGCYASITATEMSPDLRRAKVYFRLVGPEAQTARAAEELEARRGEFQRHVAAELKMKFCPVLRFEFGRVTGVDPIDQMLENLRRPRIGFD